MEKDKREIIQQKDNLLNIEQLRVCFQSKRGQVNAVDGVDISIHPGEILGIVGESGCGKSVTALSVLKLLGRNAVIDRESVIQFEEKELARMGEDGLRQIRGKDIAMIFQDPMTSLNPVMTIEKQLVEVIRQHQKISRKEARACALEMLRKVGIPSPEKRLKEYPFQLSGGMKQRVVIAMALMCHPKLLIADEPTTALDVTIQAQILQLIKRLQTEISAAIMLITHDMGVVAALADQVAIMYAGEVVEYGRVKEIFKHPRHPYTSGLLKSIPRLDVEVEELYSIEGTVPRPEDMPKGCRFCPRCNCASAECRTERPRLYSIGEGKVRCFKYQKADEGIHHE